MRDFLIGTAMVIGGGLLFMLLPLFGFSHQHAVIMGATVSILGFCVQMGGAFSVKNAFERDLQQSQQEHEALIRRARELPPEEGIQLLLKNRG